MTDSEHHRRLERLYEGAPVSRWYGVRIAISDGRAEVRLATRPEFDDGGELLGHGSGVFSRSAIALNPDVGYV